MFGAKALVLGFVVTGVLAWAGGPTGRGGSAVVGGAAVGRASLVGGAIAYVDEPGLHGVNCLGVLDLAGMMRPTRVRRDAPDERTQRHQESRPHHPAISRNSDQRRRNEPVPPRSRLRATVNMVSQSPVLDCDDPPCHAQVGRRANGPVTPATRVASGGLPHAGWACS